jgi:predicted HicB family RNase H-like nuclease
MNAMNYKGYTAKIEFSHDDECFIGYLIGINDVVGFHGESLQQLKDAFTEAVEDYLATCKLLESKLVNKASQKH